MFRSLARMLLLTLPLATPAMAAPCTRTDEAGDISHRILVTEEVLRNCGDKSRVSDALSRLELLRSSTVSLRHSQRGVLSDDQMHRVVARIEAILATATTRAP